MLAPLILFCHGTSDIFSLPLVVQHPDALRHTMLVAAMHYAWIVGDARVYEAAFLHHKIESIRLLNRWLEEPLPGGLATAIRHMATLCLTEVCAVAGVFTACVLTCLVLFWKLGGSGDAS